jgi:hypothetical protein
MERAMLEFREAVQVVAEVLPSAPVLHLEIPVWKSPGFGQFHAELNRNIRLAIILLSLQREYETVGLACHRGLGFGAHWFAVINVGCQWIMVSDRIVDKCCSFDKICAKYDLQVSVDSFILRKNCNESSSFNSPLTQICYDTVQSTLSSMKVQPLRKSSDACILPQASRQRNEQKFATSTLPTCRESKEMTVLKNTAYGEHLICSDCRCLISGLQLQDHKHNCAGSDTYDGIEKSVSICANCESVVSKKIYSVIGQYVKGNREHILIQQHAVCVEKFLGRKISTYIRRGARNWRLSVAFGCQKKDNY